MWVQAQVVTLAQQLEVSCNWNFIRAKCNRTAFKVLCSETSDKGHIWSVLEPLIKDIQN